MTNTSTPRLSPQTEPYAAKGSAPKVMLTAQQTVQSLEGDIYAILSYRPDKHVVTEQTFSNWIEQAAQTEWGTWEELATAMTDGFYDTALPLQMQLQLDISEQDGITHSVTLTRCQPEKKEAVKG